MFRRQRKDSMKRLDLSEARAPSAPDRTKAVVVVVVVVVVAVAAGLQQQQRPWLLLMLILLLSEVG